MSNEEGGGEGKTENAEKIKKTKNAASGTLGKASRKKIKLGAPSAYRVEYAQKMITYFRDYVESARSGIPEFIEFALSLGVSDDTLRNWRDGHAEFAEAYSVCKSIQRWYLQQTGLSGRNNPRMTQFLLSANHKLSEYARRSPDVADEARSLSTDDLALLRRIELRLKNDDDGDFDGGSYEH